VRVHYALATLCLILALLAKPAAVVVPLLALILDRMVLQRPWRAVIRATAAWLVLIVPILIITRLVQPAADVPSAPLWARPLIAADALAFYVAKLVWPFDLTMAYDRPPRAVLQSGAVFWTWIVPAALGVLAYLSRRRCYIAAGLLVVAGVLPVLGLTKFTFQQFSTVADRFFYLSMLGVALGVACLIAHFRADRRIHVAAAVVIALLAVRSFVQAGTWSDAETLYRHAVAAAPTSAVAHGNLAAVLIDRRAFADAAPHAARAVEQQPDSPGLRRNYALALDHLGDYRALVEQLEALARLAPAPEISQWLDNARRLARQSATTAPSPPAPASAPF
jgi:tetratricopeptide (TPR) repeat protein